MTWTEHASVGVAQAVFYLPTLFIAAYLAIFKHGSPRLAWISLAIFSLVRITGGILLIIHEQQPTDITLIIVGLVFQGTGVIPLILSTFGLLQIIKQIDFPENVWFGRSIIITRYLFLSAVALVSAGSALQGVYTNPDLARTGTTLSKTGYLELIVLVGGLAGHVVFLWVHQDKLSRDQSKKMVVAMSMSIPFLIIRIAYSCLTAFSGNFMDPTWSPLFGSIAALVVMHSLTEYIAVLIHLTLGCIIPPVVSKGKVLESRDEEAGAIAYKRDNRV